MSVSTLHVICLMSFAVCSTGPVTMVSGNNSRNSTHNVTTEASKHWDATRIIDVTTQTSEHRDVTWKIDVRTETTEHWDLAEKKDVTNETSEHRDVTGNIDVTTETSEHRDLTEKTDITTEASEHRDMTWKIDVTTEASEHWDMTGEIDVTTKATEHGNKPGKIDVKTEASGHWDLTGKLDVTTEASVHWDLTGKIDVTTKASEHRDMTAKIDVTTEASEHRDMTAKIDVTTEAVEHWDLTGKIDVTTEASEHLALTGKIDVTTEASEHWDMTGKIDVTQETTILTVTDVTTKATEHRNKPGKIDVTTEASEHLDLTEEIDVTQDTAILTVTDVTTQSTEHGNKPGKIDVTTEASGHWDLTGKIDVTTETSEHRDVTGNIDVTTEASVHWALTGEIDVTTKATEHLHLTEKIDVSQGTAILTVTDAQSDVVTCNVTETPPILIDFSSSRVLRADDDISTSDSPVDDLATVTGVEIHNNYSDMVTSGTYGGVLSFTLDKNSFTIGFLFICWAGLFGNTIALILLNRKGINKLPCRLLMIALTFNDSLYLLIHVAYPVLFSVMDTWICIAMMYVYIPTLFYSKLLVMGISLFRFFAICFPFKAKAIINRNSEMMYCLISFLVIVATWCYGPHFHEVVPIQTKDGVAYHCSLAPEGLSYVTNILGLLQMVFTLIPTAVITVCTVIMVVSLVRSSTLSGRNVSSNSGAKNNARAASVLLVTICISFIVLGMPMIIYMVVYPEVVESFQNLDTLGQICLIMEQLNFAGNSVFYIAGGSMFRKEIKLLYLEVIAKTCRRNDDNIEV